MVGRRVLELTQGPQGLKLLERRLERRDSMAMSMAAHSILLLFPLAAHSLTIAITGTNSGIGQSAARQLLEQGHEIIHACRDEAAARDAAARAAAAPRTRATSPTSAPCARSRRACARRPELDVLCLNAGVSPSRKAEAPRAHARRL